MLVIPDIRNDADAVLVIDELKYRLKARILLDCQQEAPVAASLNQALNRIIREHGLDSDPGEFATTTKVTAPKVEVEPTKQHIPLYQSHPSL